MKYLLVKMNKKFKSKEYNFEFEILINSIKNK